MSRKKWTSKEEQTPSLLRFREKRKWQIALRRYVLEKNPSVFYAPYFGLDIENIRKWFEMQFAETLSWENFGKTWQFDHIIPVTYFDFNSEEDLKMCWNFTNLRVEGFQNNKDRGNRLDILAAKIYFEDLYIKTNYQPCKKLLQKIDTINLSLIVSSEQQRRFIAEHRDYLDIIENYTAFEFELINRGRNIEDVKKESAFIKKYGN